MRATRTFLLLGAAAILLTAVSCWAAPPLIDLQREGRLDVRVPITKEKPLPIAAVFQEIGKAAGITLVAGKMKPQDKFQPEMDQPTARALLIALADRYEGDWRVVGKTYVLGAPAGFEEVADLSPVRYREYEQEQWQRVIRALRPRDWGRLRSEGLLDASELRPGLKEPVAHLVQVLCYRLDQPLIRMMSPERSLVGRVRKQKFCLGLVDEGKRLTVVTYSDQPELSQSIEEFPLQ